MKTPRKPLIIPIFIPHFGCPHQCIFCNQQSITGASGSDASGAIPSETEIHSIIHQYLEFKKDRSWTEVSFFGGNFLGLAPANIVGLLDQVAPFVASGQINGIRFSTRPDTIDKNRLDLIRPYPVSTVELGVQSMNARVLNQSHRGHTAKDTLSAVALLKKENCQIGLQMMTGLPGDNDTLCLETARQIIGLKPDFVRIYPTLVLAGSPLAVAYKAGKYRPQSLEASVDLLKKLYLLFQENQIEVIRMGLQASESLDDPATVLAGPYHPALGHLVFSKILLDTAIEKIRKKTASAKKTANDTVTLTVHPKSLSRMQGLNKTNLDILKQLFGVQHIDLKTDTALDKDAVRVN